MELSKINQYFGNIDIYLLDLILKGAFHPGMKILDAGCGEGRNLMYFLNSGYNVYGVDKDPKAINAVRFVSGSLRPDISRDQFQVARLENLPFENDYFDLSIVSAVLHFARDIDHFLRMVDELVRCLKPNGILFIRMASDIGIEDKVISKSNGQFKIPDGSIRFLLNQKLVQELTIKHSLEFIQPLKTVNVDDLRCMTNLVLKLG